MAVGDNMEIMKYYKQKRILHKYVNWLYDLLIDGRFYETQKCDNITGVPAKGSYRAWMRPIYHNKEKDSPDVRTIPLFERMYHCGENLEGYLNPKTGEHKVTSGIFCGDRLCPVCQVRKAIREYSRLNFAMEQFGKKYTYYFLTLTLPNNYDGFRDELKLINSILPALGDFVGYKGEKDRFSLCEGIYGSYEITRKDSGWHPHLHLVLAFPSEYIESTDTVRKVINGRERVFENGLKLRCGKRELTLSQDSIMNRYIELVQKKTKVYDERLEDLRFLDIGFQPCYNIEDCTNEMSKYLIDFLAIDSVEDLFVYLRDSYRLPHRVKRGCFKQGEEFEEAWKKHLDERHVEETKNFVQCEEVIEVNFVYKFGSYYAWYDYEVEENVPYTNRTKKVLYARNFILVPDPGGGTMVWQAQPDIKLRDWIDKL